MNDASDFHTPGFQSESELEGRLFSIARTFSYPPAPDISADVIHRLTEKRRYSTYRLRLALGILLVLVFTIIFAVPPVRAAVLGWIQIGAVRIFMTAPTLTPTPTVKPGSTITLRPTDRPTPTPLTSILDLSGETTLEQAQMQSFPILLPAYPPDLGQPDHMFLQDFGGPVVILVWMEKDRPQSVRLAISETNINGAIFQKIAPPTIENATVNRHPAIWVDAPYVLITGNGSYDLTRLISTGHTLIWSDGQMTYRLETGVNLATAIKIAESVR